MYIMKNFKINQNIYLPMPENKKPRVLFQDWKSSGVHQSTILKMHLNN